MSRLTRDGTRLNPSRQTKFPGANRDRGKKKIPIQLTTSRIGRQICQVDPHSAESAPVASAVQLVTSKPSGAGT